MWIRPVDRLPEPIIDNASVELPIAMNMEGDIIYVMAFYSHELQRWFAGPFRFTSNDVLFWFDLPPLPEY